MEVSVVRQLKKEQVLTFLFEIDISFKPSLSSRLLLEEYAEKLHSMSEIFASVDPNGRIVGAIFCYANDVNLRNAYIPILGVVTDCRGGGVAKALFQNLEEYLLAKGFSYLSLETWLGGDALAFYIKNGFFIETMVNDRPNGGVSIKLKKSLALKDDTFSYNPSPLELSNSLSFDLGVNLYLKRDDLFQSVGGGSKARKLNYILKKAVEQGCNAVVTTGGAQSNHLRSTAIMCASHSLKLTAVVHSKVPEVIEGNLLLTSLSGADVRYVEMSKVKQEMDEAVLKYIRSNMRPFYIWGGGHLVEGSFAYYKAVFELKHQLGDTIPDFIIVPSGTGTTQAGIEVGVRRLFPNCKVLGVSVARNRERGTEAVSKCVNELLDRLNLNIDHVDDIFFDDSFVGDGYEETYPELLVLIKEVFKNTGVLLDPTYTGKAFNALRHYITSGIIPKKSNVIFWHTGGLLNLISSKEIKK